MWILMDKSKLRPVCTVPSLPYEAIRNYALYYTRFSNTQRDPSGQHDWIFSPRQVHLNYYGHLDSVILAIHNNSAKRIIMIDLKEKPLFPDSYFQYQVLSRSCSVGRLVMIHHAIICRTNKSLFRRTEEFDTIIISSLHALNYYLFHNWFITAPKPGSF